MDTAACTVDQTNAILKREVGIILSLRNHGVGMEVVITRNELLNVGLDQMACCRETTNLAGSRISRFN